MGRVKAAANTTLEPSEIYVRPALATRTLSEGAIQVVVRYDSGEAQRNLRASACSDASQFDMVYGPAELVMTARILDRANCPLRTTTAPAPPTSELGNGDGTSLVGLSGSTSGDNSTEDDTTTWVLALVVACLLVGMVAAVAVRRKRTERSYSPDDMGPAALPAIFMHEIGSTPYRRPASPEHHDEETPDKNALDKKTGVVRPLDLQWDPYVCSTSYPESLSSARSSTTSSTTHGSPTLQAAASLNTSINMEPAEMYGTPERMLAPHQPPRQPALLELDENLTDSDTDV